MRKLYLATDDCIDDLREALKDKPTETDAYDSCLFYHCGVAKEEVRPLNTTINHP